MKAIYLIRNLNTYIEINSSNEWNYKFVVDSFNKINIYKI